jgi:hypothetical protein
MDKRRVLKHFPLSFVLLIGLVCFSITMQMLGISFSMWDLDETPDLVASSLLEGFSTPSRYEDFSATHYVGLSFLTASLHRSLLLEHSLFHPPDLLV